MNYKVSCPSCGKKVSRWHIFLEPVIYHRCRGCGTLFRPSWIGVLLVMGIQFLWWLLAKFRFINPPVAIILVIVTCILAIWLLPYVTSTHLKEKKPGV